jgi:hypothetical protein
MSDTDDSATEPLAPPPPPTELDLLMERYARRAMDVELDYVVRGRRTVAAQPPLERVAEVLAARSTDTTAARFPPK